MIILLDSPTTWPDAIEFVVFMLAGCFVMWVLFRD